MTEIRDKTKKIQEGALVLLERKIIEIEKTAADKNKDSEIHRLTIPYLHLQNTLEQYLPKKEIKNLDLRYANSIKKYWEIKK